MKPGVSSAGFTLIETLVAIVLIAVVLPVGLAVISQATRAVGIAERRDIARRVAESRLARLVLDGSWATSGTGGTCDPSEDGEDATGYQWQMALSSWGDGSMKELRLTICRNSPADATAVTIATLVQVSK